MKKYIPILLIFAICASLSANNAFLGYLYPAGGQKGTVVRVIAGGQRFGGKISLISSNPGIKLKSAVRIPYMGYFQPPQRKWLTDFLKNLYSGKTEKPPIPENKEGYTWRKHQWLDELDKLPLLERSIVAHSIFVRPNALQAAPSISTRILLELEIAPDAAEGACRIRLAAGRNISNEKLFFVNSAAEIIEPPYYPPFAKKPPTECADKFPAILNGQIMPGETDVFPLILEAGQPYTFAMCAAELSPYLGDTVPGHFQGILTLRDAENREVAFADDEYHHPDPVMRFTPAKSGRYSLHISDSIKRGRADFVYRVNITKGTLPFTPYANKSSYSPKTQAIDAGTAGTITPQMYQNGIDIKGRITSVNGKTFKIQAAKNERLIFEVFAARLDSPLDSVLVLRDENREIIAENDDAPSKLDLDICRRQTDSKIDITFPANGIYSLELRPRTSNCKDNFYTLQIRRPEPSVLAVSGMSVLDFDRKGFGKMRFYIKRKDGFSGEVKITSPQLKAAKNSIIKPDKDSIEIIFYMKKPPRKNHIMQLNFNAEYSVNGKKYSVPVIPADETMQAFAYTHLVAAENFYCYTMRPVLKKGSVLNID